MNYSTPEERQAFYQSQQWKDLRAYKLRLNPFCERCLTKGTLKPASEVHHRIDIIDDPSKIVDFTNLEALCKSCHSSHTFKETRKRMSTRPRGHIKRLYNLE